MEQELLKIKQNLKKKTTKEKQLKLGEQQQDFTQEKQNSIRSQFFDSGVKNWFTNLEKFTFPTDFVDLQKQEALELVQINKNVKQNKNYDEIFLNDIIQQSKIILELENKILNVLNQHKKDSWEKVFIKLSTRSPKDSKLILKKSQKEFNNVQNIQNMSDSEKVEIFASIVQNNFSVTNPRQAILQFITSDRVLEDIEYALEGEYEKFQMQIVIRKWEQTIPISKEFRGFVQKGELNALGQYYHTLYFKELQNQQEIIKNDIQQYYQQNIQKIIPKELQNCIIDFAYLGKNNIIMIEINPFDGESLGCYPGSTGLFNWENNEDKYIIQNGPLQIRIKQDETDQIQLKHKLNNEWRDIIFPPKHLITEK